jgi:hypothetical protein
MRFELMTNWVEASCATATPRTHITYLSATGDSNSRFDNGNVVCYRYTSRAIPRRQTLSEWRGDLWG